MIELIWKKILRRPGFSLWAVPALLLWLVSLLYRVGLWLAFSNRSKAKKVSVPVISVGNISVGGTGKTPIVAMLARSLIDESVRVGIVSSGYGRLDNSESILEQGYRVQKISVDKTGDEIKFLAKLLPEAFFSVDRIKTNAAVILAESGEVDVIIVDDGYQHHGLARDLDIVTFDAAVEKRHLKLFPYGVLREPISALGRADVIIMTRSSFARDLGQYRRLIDSVNSEATQFRAQFIPSELIGSDGRRPLKYLEDKSVYLFAGIGNYSPLEKQVTALCADLDRSLELSDHQVYNTKLLERIRDEAADLGTDVILTTGKDWSKLGDFAFEREIYYLGQSVDLDPGEEKLTRLVINKLGLVN